MTPIFYLTPIRMAKINNAGTADAAKDVEKEKHSFIDGVQAGTTTLELDMVIPQKIGHSTT